MPDRGIPNDLPGARIWIASGAIPAAGLFLFATLGSGFAAPSWSPDSLVDLGAKRFIIAVSDHRAMATNSFALLSLSDGAEAWSSALKPDFPPYHSQVVFSLKATPTRGSRQTSPTYRFGGPIPIPYPGNTSP